MRNMKNTHRMGGKPDIRWTGPYEVVEDCGKMRYKLKSRKAGNVLKTTMKNACPYQPKFGEKIQNISGTVATAKYSRVYSINLYTCLLIHTCVHLDMLNMGIQWGYGIH